MIVPRQRFLSFLGLALLGAMPAAAQDPEIEALLLAPREIELEGEVDAKTIQIYRIPVSLTLRDPEEKTWGMRFTLPVSFGFHDLRAASDPGDLRARFETVSVSPGLEVQFPVARRWLVKPFAELAVGSAPSEGENETLWAAGLRAQGNLKTGNARITVGGAARYASGRAERIRLTDYTTIEAGVDAQWPTRLRAQGYQPRVGVYGVVRTFLDLQFEAPGREPIDFGEVYEIGISFSTDPVLTVWKMRLPWLAVGYRFGDLFDGIRVSFSFPF
jgi:hypothetical protein